MNNLAGAEDAFTTHHGLSSSCYASWVLLLVFGLIILTKVEPIHKVDLTILVYTAANILM
jgi:hypothetical protein